MISTNAQNKEYLAGNVKVNSIRFYNLQVGSL